MTRTKIVKIGNSKGIRIPNTLLAQMGIGEGDEVSIGVEDDRLIVQPVVEVRQGWNEAFAEMAKAGDDALLDAPTATQWDDEEWQW